MNIKPIRNEREHHAALREIERLWDAKPGTEEFDRLDVLSTLVERYESEHLPMTLPDVVSAVLFRLEQLGWPKSILASVLGGRSRASEFLRRKRDLSLTQTRNLFAMGVPADVLLAPLGHGARGRGPGRRAAKARKASPPPMPRKRAKPKRKPTTAKEHLAKH